jgi:PhoH-like ATPase
MSSKYFILDTNVLLHNPSALYSFSDNTVIIPLTVVEELDKFKSFSDKKGKHARQVLREIDTISRKGALTEGAKIKTGGKIKIVIPTRTENFPLDQNLPDNNIISVAFTLLHQGAEVYFISKDVNARIKAIALGIKANDYEKQKVEYTSLYRGWRDMTITDDELATFFEHGQLDTAGILFNDNEYVALAGKDSNPDHRVLGRYSAEKKAIIPIKTHFESLGIKPRNLEQHFAFDLLLNDTIAFATLIGQAGTGKTLIAIACALQKVLSKQSHYQKLLVARPIMPLGKDIGYLPGTKDQKLNYWMQPIFDNLDYILQKEGAIQDNSLHGSPHKDTPIRDQINYLLESGIIEIEAITYIRGRSIPNQIIIIDEAQNLTPHEVKTIVSRVGEGTKIILTGDPEQIDNPYLDVNSNGLSYSADRLKNNPITGHILLAKSERSTLASLAAELL